MATTRTAQKTEPRAAAQENAVAKTDQVSKDVAVQDDDVINDATLYQHAGKGSENVRGDDLSLPFLSILQSNSPQCKKSDPAYIKGAEEGFLLNALEGEVYDPKETEIYVVPAYFEKVLIEWRPREEGGGFVRVYGRDDAILREAERDDKNKDRLPNGNILALTAQHYCLLVKPNGDITHAVIAMSSTQLKKSRKWLSVIRTIIKKRPDGSTYNPPMFAHKYRVTTVAESNDQGSWMGWNFELAGLVTKGQFNAGLGLYQAVEGGRVRAAAPTAQQVNVKDDDKIPF